ncbi:MAG: hypothetical protein FJX74_19785 [Armatimonadetes bacterium]|nr:hypothetical protein [Armatimonadota bacterium]
MTGRWLCKVGALWVLGAAALTTARADWPMYRHDPARSGQAEGPAPTLAETAWTANLGGPVDSSPAVVSGLVVAGTTTGGLHALNAETGAPLWQAEIGSPIVSAPCVVDGRICFGATDGYVYGYDLPSGGRLWRARTGRSVVAPPLAIGGRVLCGSTDGRLYALDPASGDALWRTEAGDEIHAGAAATEDVVVFADWSGRVTCVRVADGAEVWPEPFAADGPVIACPVITGSRVVVCSLSRSQLTPGHSTNVDVLDLATGRRVWGAPGRNPWQTDKEGVMSVATPATVLGDAVWFLTGEGYGNWQGILRSVALETGARGQMIRPRGGSGVCFSDSAAAAVGPVLYLADYGAYLYQFNAATLRFGAAAALGARTVSSPAISDGCAYLGLADGRLVCFR